MGRGKGGGGEHGFKINGILPGPLITQHEKDFFQSLTLLHSERP